MGSVFSQAKLHSLKRKADKAGGRGNPGLKDEYRKSRKQRAFEDTSEGSGPTAHCGGQGKEGKT